MPRKPRIEYEGAVYHVMCRGNGGESIFWSDKDRKLFIDTLDEVCGRCGWRIHAFCLMSNHYHLLLETPEANLVRGMKWFQGTYTQRFNSRNKRWGHLFQGRYKALVVESETGDYFSTLAGYIHLNPARSKLFDLMKGDLTDYRWSSYPLYLDPPTRPKWLCVERVMGNHQWRDNAAGRCEYRDYMQSRVVEIAGCENSEEYDARWKKIRGGWYLGGEPFRKELVDRLDGVLAGKQRSSFSGEQVLGYDEQEAERLVQLGLETLGLSNKELDGLRKNCAEKYAVAWLVRRNTCVKNQWIKERLVMGKATNFSTFLGRMERGEFGAECFQSIKKIIS
ncbi:MAG: transposase [Pontiellaceae bacterium]|nr:transposase [Pontiellaceae bacterium]